MCLDIIENDLPQFLRDFRFSPEPLFKSRRRLVQKHAQSIDGGKARLMQVMMRKWPMRRICALR